MREHRAKAKVKMAKKAAESKDRIIKLGMERSMLKKVNTSLRHQMFSEAALRWKNKNIELKGEDLYDLEFGRRMDCLLEHYESPFVDSSADEVEETRSKGPQYKDQAVQTTKKSNKDTEIEMLKQQLIECT